MRRFRLFKERAGVISTVPLWVLLDNEGYMYTAKTLVGLAHTCWVYWRDDRMLVG